MGESINGTIPEVGEAILNHDEVSILNLARIQIECGANMLDINAGVAGGNEPENLAWLVQLIQSKYNTPIMFDSDDPNALKKAFPVYKNNLKPIINSISGDSKKLDVLLPVVAEQGCGVVALCLNEHGIPHIASERLKIAEHIVKESEAYGIKPEQIYLDPLVFGISSNYQAAAVTQETIRLIRENIPEANIICGLSNVSHGVPARKLVNRTFLAMNICLGMEAFIIDVRDKELMATAITAWALVGKDPNCKGLITAYRKKLLGS